MNRLLLLPSARLIPPELRVDFGDIPSGMIPLNSQPALHHIAGPYTAADFNTLVAVSDRAAMVEEYVCRSPDLRVKTVNVGITRSIGETVATALHSLAKLPGLLVVNFADTLLGEVVIEPDAVCYQELEELFRWTAFEFDETWTIRRVFEKGQMKPARAPQPVFVGVCSFSDPRRFLALLDRAVENAGAGVDPYWDAVVEYHNGLPPERRRLKPAKEWHDFGHLDTYYAMQRSFFLNQRCFNSMSVDLGRGVVRKASTHAGKLAREIEWYLALPASLQYLGPRVFEYRKECGETSAEMEFYGYPALNDVYLHGEWDPGVWAQVLRAIGRAVDGMCAHKLTLAAGERREALRSMYESKTRERLEPILDDPRFAALTGDAVVINGRRCPGLRRCLQIMPAVLERAGLYESSQFTIIHGDLCLSNILYDRRSGFVRLVDPRGSFGASGIYGDSRYDLAKLSHSFHGDYDFYVNGLFHLEVSGQEVHCAPFRRAAHENIRRMFDQWLRAREGAGCRLVHLIESLLFLSMVPLHGDRPWSQLAFLARGLELFQAAADDTQNSLIEVFHHVAADDKHPHYHGR
jgi:hypothetical protein